MVNYESVIIETNQELVKEGKEPLYVVYPVDGLAIADSPLGYVNHGNADREKAFRGLQRYLLSKSTQKKIVHLGRRAGLLGVGGTAADRDVFNPDWGIKANAVLNP